MNKRSNMWVPVLLGLVSLLLLSLGPRLGWDNFKTYAESVEAIITALGILVGGWWTYTLFVRKREDYPRAKLIHQVIQRGLPEGKRLLHVINRVTNTGQVLLSLDFGFCRVQQVLPIPAEFADALQRGEDPVEAGKTEYPWPLLAERDFRWERSPRELEPGESEDVFCDFVVDPDTEVVEIYAYLKNKEKVEREIGWNLTTLYDVRQGKVLLQSAPKAQPPKKGRKGSI